MDAAGRDEFAQMLVHNLKTPLTGIMASLEMLHDGDFGKLNPAQRSAIEVMRTQSNDLLAMIDELLELGRMESAGILVQERPVDVAALLDRIAEEWRPRLGGRLTSDTAADLAAVPGDAAVLRRVIGNLLMNALVHGGTGVGVRMVAEAAGGDAVRILVADDGPGIPAGDAERVFDPFVRLDTGAGRGHKTSGLGLTYCRAAVAAMGGTIRLVPSNRGATFQLDMPGAVATRDGAEPAS